MQKAIVSLLCLLVSLAAGVASGSDFRGAHFIRPAEPLSLYGQLLPGLMGTSEGAARVEVLSDAGDTLLPLQISHVGAGIYSSSATGDFDIILNSSILTNRLFVRVYDTDDPATAHYYFESAPFQFDDEITHSRKLVFSEAKSIQPLDETDSDGDGLTDLEETSGALGFVTDPFKADTDGDGINDDVELVYGLNPTKPLEVVLTSTPATSPASVVPLTQDWMIEWSASTNPYVLYTLEMVQDLLDIQEGDFPSAAAAQRVVRSKKDIQASRTNWSELVTEWMKTNSIGFFRVRQDLQPLPTDEGSAEPDEGDGD